MKPGISAVVVAYNQADLLKKCLASIRELADEIIVIDLESTQDIAVVAKRYQATIIKHKKVAIVEHIREESLSYAHHEYVLFIDPDESIPTELAKDLAVQAKKATYDYFIMPRQNIVFDKWVAHSRWWPDMQTRMFRRSSVAWGKELHAPPVMSGAGYTYPSDARFAIHHENYRSLDEFLEKNTRYAKADAAERLEHKHPLSLMEAVRLSVSEMMSRLFLGEGYKDGMHGLVLALLQSFYYFMVYAYYWEGMKYSELETEKSIKQFPRLWFSHGLTETLYWEPKKSHFGRLKNKLARKLMA